MCFAPQRRALFRHLNLQKRSEHGVFCTFWLRNVLRATTACTFSTSQLPKVLRTPHLFALLTSKCASRHNGAHFFDISTSKSGPNLLCATTTCTFSTSQLPKVVRAWCVLYILTSKCASSRNGVHFFDISTSKSGPSLRCFVHFDFEMCFAPQRRTIFHLSSGQLARRFSKPTFRPSGASNHWKNIVFTTFLPFRASASSFFWLFLFSDLLSSTLLLSLPLPSSAFHLSILSEVWLLNFLR